MIPIRRDPKSNLNNNFTAIDIDGYIFETWKGESRYRECNRHVETEFCFCVAASSLQSLKATSESPLMYPFGSTTGDIVVTSTSLASGNCDNGYTSNINVISGFPYFNKIQSSIAVSTSGRRITRG